MKMNIKRYLLLAVGTFASVAAMAQQEEQTINRQVDVSRQYAPEVRQALKLSVVPNMVDTAALRPDYEYTIYPKAWATGFGVEAINPVQLYASDFAKRYPFYVKAGGGAPAQSLLDIYGVTTDWKNGYVGGYVNHYGQYDKRKDDMGIKAKNGFVTNDIGAFGALKTGARTSLSGELGFEYNTWDRNYSEYTFEQQAASDRVLIDKSVGKVKYSMPKGKIEFGNDFKDLSRFNFSIGADFYSLKEKESKDKETGFSIYGKVGQQFDVHKFTLGVKGEVIDGDVENNLGYFNSILTFSPTYGIKTDLFTLNAGLDVVFDYYSDDEDEWTSGRGDEFYLLPQARIEFGADGAPIVPFAELSSRLVKNNMCSLMRLNPLAAGTMGLKNGRSYDLRAGAYGAITPSVGYRVYAGGGIEKDIPFFASHSHTDNIYYSPGLIREGVVLSHYVAGDYSRITYFTLGGELETRLGGSFTGVFGAKYHKYSAKANTLRGNEKMSYVYGRPDYELSLKATYNHNDKLFLRGGLDLLGKTKHYFTYFGGGTSLADGEDKVSNTLNLSLEAEYFFKPQLGVFLSGSNLLGQDIYYFSNYKDDKMRVNAGVKLLF